MLTSTEAEVAVTYIRDGSGSSSLVYSTTAVVYSTRTPLIDSATAGNLYLETKNVDVVDCMDIDEDYMDVDPVSGDNDAMNVDPISHVDDAMDVDMDG